MLCFGHPHLGFLLFNRRPRGHPGNLLRKTVAFAKKLNLDYVQFSKCLAKPLNPALERDGGEGKERLLAGTGYWEKKLTVSCPRPWTELTNPEIDQLARWAYVSYYARPGFLWKHLLKIGSPLELKRKVLALADMLWKQESYSRPEDDFKAFNENPEAKVRKYQKSGKNEIVGE